MDIKIHLKVLLILGISCEIVYLAFMNPHMFFYGMTVGFGILCYASLYQLFSDYERKK